MDLLYLFRSLLRKKWIIIFSTLIGLAAGILFASTKLKKTYTSLAQYSTGFTMNKAVTVKSDDAINIYEIDFKFRNVIETFKSPSVLGMLGYNLLLHDLESPEPFRTLSAEKLKKPEATAIGKERAKQILREKLLNLELLSNVHPEEKKVRDLVNLYGYGHETLMKNILPERAMGTDYMNIWFKSENPELSAFVVNKAGAEFERFFSKIYGAYTTESAGKLDSLIRAKKKELDDKTDVYKKFRTELGAPDIGGRSVAAMEVVKDATSRFTDENAKLNTLKAQLKSVIDQLGILGPAGSNAVVNNNSELLRLQNENKSLASQLAQKGGTDAQIQNAIDANNKKILALTPSQTGGANRNAKLQDARDELNRQKFQLEADIYASQQNVALYRSKMQQYEGLANSGGGATVLASAYENDLKILTNEYELLKGSQQASKDADVAPDINFKQTLVGQAPLNPDPSKKLLVIAGAGIAMLVLSTMLIVLLDLLDTSLRTPSIFMRNTRLKLLSSVSKVDLKKKDVAYYFNHTGDNNRTEQETIFVENLRKLRYEIQNSGKKVFLFTSARPKEGKTTIMEALATGLSMSKKKVLMIDSNFSNNTLTKKFEAKPSLEQFSVNGEKNPLEKFWNVTSVTNIPNVDIVGCQEGNYTPSEVLPKNNLLENLRAVSEHYDFVFIEGAALNTHADSKELSRYVDGIVSVFSTKSVIRQTDKESILFLKGTGDKFIGAVLNGVEVENLEL